MVIVKHSIENCAHTKVCKYISDSGYCLVNCKHFLDADCEKDAWYAGCRKGSEGHGFPSYGAAIDRAYEDWENNKESK